MSRRAAHIHQVKHFASCDLCEARTQDPYSALTTKPSNHCIHRYNIDLELRPGITTLRRNQRLQPSKASHSELRTTDPPLIVQTGHRGLLSHSGRLWPCQVTVVGDIAILAGVAITGTVAYERSRPWASRTTAENDMPTTNVYGLVQLLIWAPRNQSGTYCKPSLLEKASPTEQPCDLLLTKTT